jgi:hypothetical protein
MKLISSRFTFLYKCESPALFFGYIILVVAVGAMNGMLFKAPSVMAVVVLFVWIGIVITKRVTWNFADEVLDGGDFLLVIRRGLQMRVPLAQIILVDDTTVSRPASIRLRLASPGILGDEVTFILPPLQSFNWYTTCKLAKGLILRVGQARAMRSQ